MNKAQKFEIQGCCKKKDIKHSMQMALQEECMRMYYEVRMASKDIGNL